MWLNKVAHEAGESGITASLEWAHKRGSKIPLSDEQVLALYNQLSTYKRDIGALQHLGVIQADEVATSALQQL